jgi:hypothetical protein
MPAPAEGPAWDYEALAEQARHDVRELKPLLAGVLDAGVLERVEADLTRPATLDDDLWVEIVYAFAVASHQGRSRDEQLAGIFVPLYLWRAAAFLARTANESTADVQHRLEALGETFQRLKPQLVGRWPADV